MTDGFLPGWSVIAPDGREVWLEGQSEGEGKAYISGSRLRVLGLDPEKLTIPLCVITRDWNRDGFIVTPDHDAIAAIRAMRDAGKE